MRVFVSLEFPRTIIEFEAIQQYRDFHTVAPGKVMASATTGARSTRLGRPPRGWVRKNIHIDQRKLDAARKILGLTTETEAVDAALDAIALRATCS
jgi:hypothetical protein